MSTQLRLSVAAYAVAIAALPLVFDDADALQALLHIADALVLFGCVLAVLRLRDALIDQRLVRLAGVNGMSRHYTATKRNDAIFGVAMTASFAVALLVPTFAPGTEAAAFFFRYGMLAGLTLLVLRKWYDRGRSRTLLGMILEDEEKMK